MTIVTPQYRHKRRLKRKPNAAATGGPANARAKKPRQVNPEPAFFRRPLVKTDRSCRHGASGPAGQ
jgi:hypothetical protein